MTLAVPDFLRNAARRLPAPIRVRLFALNSRRGFYNELTKQREEYSLWPFIRTRSIFIHIPKAAGITIAKSLYGNLAGGHRTYREYEAIFGSSIRSYFVFSFVRHPITRLHSAWRFLRKGGINHWDRAWCERYLLPDESFDAFVMRRLDAELLAHSLHLRPQSEFLRANDGRCAVDFIGKLESIDADYAKVCERLKIARPLVSENRSTEQSKLNELPPKVLERIRDVYAADFALLNYPTTL